MPGVIAISGLLDLTACSFAENRQGFVVIKVLTGDQLAESDRSEEESPIPRPDLG